jgi:hypothetical protein
MEAIFSDDANPFNDDANDIEGRKVFSEETGHFEDNKWDSPIHLQGNC